MLGVWRFERSPCDYESPDIFLPLIFTPILLLSCTQTRRQDGYLRLLTPPVYRRGPLFFLLPSPRHRKDGGGGVGGCEVRAPSWSYTLTSCEQLYCRVYVECVTVPQRLPQSDSKEVGQQRDPVQPELSRPCVCKCIRVCVCVCPFAVVCECVGMCSTVCNLFPSARNQPDLPRLPQHQASVCVCVCVCFLWARVFVTAEAPAELCTMSLWATESAVICRLTAEAARQTGRALFSRFRERQKGTSTRDE